MKYTKEILEPIVSESISVAQVLKKLGLRPSGGMHCHITRKIKAFGINTSHFLGKRSNHGKNHKGGIKFHWTQVLVLRTNGRRQKAFVLRRALIESGIEYKCDECEITIWRKKEIILQVDHKNGNWLDDRKENLRFLCPNCHSQSPNYCGSKGYSDLMSWNKGYKEARNRKVTKKLMPI